GWTTLRQVSLRSYGTCKSGIRSGRAHRAHAPLTTYIEQPIATARTALTANTAPAVARNAAASTRLIFANLRHALQSSRHKPIQAVTPARAGIGMWETVAAPNHRIATRNNA